MAHEYEGNMVNEFESGEPQGSPSNSSDGLCSDQVLKRWIIVKPVGRVPIKKCPENSERGLINMLRNLLQLWPDDTSFIVARLAYGNDLWLDDGREYLTIHDAMTEGA